MVQKLLGGIAGPNEGFKKKVGQSIVVVIVGGSRIASRLCNTSGGCARRDRVR